MTYTLWHVLLALSISIPIGLRNVRMARVWLVFAGATLAAWAYQSIPFYIAVDLIAAAIVLAKPRCVWQKLIGVIILTMATLGLGFMISEVAFAWGYVSSTPNQAALWDVYMWLSYFELAVFFLWGGHDAMGRFIGYSSGRTRSILVDKDRAD